ncbi:small hydrophobic protein [Streptomyces sp. NPDC047002]|uniref:small hydrophobic protein n=1 Tax=Streptomyces sp. NPDC047002 TaxID=3155475 RepID=UPI00345178DB
MAGFGSTRTRMSPRSRGRMGSRSGPDRATFGIIGLVCAIAGFFVLGIVLGPIALITGWLSMDRRWSNRHVPAVIAVVLGAIDTVIALTTLF